MVEGLKIRPAKAGDLPELSRIYVDVYTAFDVGEVWSVDRAKKLLAHFLKIQPDLCLVAELDGELVGGFFAKIKPWCDGNRLTESEIFVSPDHQKKGIGSQLAKALYRKAIKKHQARYFEAVTFKNEKHPLGWYKKQGFKEIDYLTLIEAELEKALKYLEEEG